MTTTQPACPFDTACTNPDHAIPTPAAQPAVTPDAPDTLRDRVAIALATVPGRDGWPLLMMTPEEVCVLADAALAVVRDDTTTHTRVAEVADALEVSGWAHAPGYVAQLRAALAGDAT